MISVKKKTGVFILLVFNINSLFAQHSIEAYIRNGAHPVSNVDTNSSDYTDMEALGNAIGDSRIVMLGEQDHGDAPTYLAKTKIIKYLHEKKGFNVLAFESDFYALNKGWKQLSKTENSIDVFLKKNIYPQWAMCNACKYLFYTYIPQSFRSSAPLQVTGFDNQLLLDFTKNDLKRSLDSLLLSLDMQDYNSNEKRRWVIASIDSLLRKRSSGAHISAKEKNTVTAFLDELKKACSVRFGENGFWTMVVQNLQSYANLGIESRDEQMANNLQWLANDVYPDQKIIVWAANGHIMKYTSQMLKELNSKTAKKAPNLIFRNMGTGLAKNEKWNKECYVLGFTSAKGKAGRLGWNVFDVPAPIKNSLEGWVNPEYLYAFIDFSEFNRNSPGKEKFHLKGFTHMYYPKQFDWNKAFDGIFYIRDMFSCSAN